jgi:hypothetical protein
VLNDNLEVVAEKANEAVKTVSQPQVGPRFQCSVEAGVCGGGHIHHNADALHQGFKVQGPVSRNQCSVEAGGVAARHMQSSADTPHRVLQIVSSLLQQSVILATCQA